MVRLGLFLLEKLGSERAVNGMIVVWCAAALCVLILLIAAGVAYYNNIYVPIITPAPEPLPSLYKVYWI